MDPLVFSTTSTGTGAAASGPTFPQLLQMKASQLDQLFANSPAGSIPNGDAQGIAIIAPGTPFASIIEGVINTAAWQGKVFDASKGLLRNKIGPAGSRKIEAKVAMGTSRLDDKPAIVLDYSKRSWPISQIRDEIRNVGPGTYLGLVYFGGSKDPIARFALQFPTE